MNKLYISDTHLGSPLFDSISYITSLITSPEFDEIYFLGDITDVWASLLMQIIYINCFSIT